MVNDVFADNIAETPHGETRVKLGKIKNLKLICHLSALPFGGSGSRSDVPEPQPFFVRSNLEQ